MYALHINKTPCLARVWLARHDDQISLAASRTNFKHKKISATLARSDKILADTIKMLYERTIDHGAHPNERAVTGSGKMVHGEKHKDLLQVYLHGDGPALEFALKTTAQCGLGSLLIFRHIFPERFALLNINDEIDRLRRCL